VFIFEKWFSANAAISLKYNYNLYTTLIQPEDQTQLAVTQRIRIFATVDACHAGA
jgi:hypothetical protein